MTDPTPAPTEPAQPDAMAATAIHALIGLAATVAVAESLTGGLVCAALTSVPGASAVMRGGVIAYATDLKAALLGVDSELLAREGAVHPDVAVAMARGVATRLDAEYGVATTGVAGPEPQDGHPVGQVYIAVAVGDEVVVRAVSLDPVLGRSGIQAATVVAALQLLNDMLAQVEGP